YIFVYMLIFCVNLLFFFFQAEDGIRDRNVTGVQTCALPISLTQDNWGAAVGGPVPKITKLAKTFWFFNVDGLDYHSTVNTGFVRSEEHTSELQSRFDLVCRLLLEKKKTPGALPGRQASSPRPSARPPPPPSSSPCAPFALTTR